MVNIKGLDKAAVLAVLYNASKPQMMGFMHYDPTPMTIEEARKLLGRGDSFDYLKGRVMKIDLSRNELDTWGYDRDNGPGAAQMAIESLQTTTDPNNVMVRAQHAAATKESSNDALANMLEETSLSEKGDVVVFRMGLGDLAPVLGPKVEEAKRSIKSPLE